MGFATLRADLSDPATHAPAFWAAHLPEGAALVSAAGLLTGSEADFRAVHHDAPAAVLRALRGPALLISAVGIQADTPFARWRRETETLFEDHCILRPGLVLGETSYGGSSLLRALAAMPVRLPVLGDGQQRFNPIHAADLAGVVAECLDKATPGTWEIGGPEVLSQAELIAGYRAWLGLPPVPPLQFRRERPGCWAVWAMRFGLARSRPRRLPSCRPESSPIPNRCSPGWKPGRAGSPLS